MSCLQIHNNRGGIAIFSLFMACYFFYFYVRIRYTLNGGFFGYSLIVLIIEFMGSTNMVRLTPRFASHLWCRPSFAQARNIKNWSLSGHSLVVAPIHCMGSTTNPFSLSLLRPDT